MLIGASVSLVLVLGCSLGIGVVESCGNASTSSAFGSLLGGSGFAGESGF